MSKKRRENKDLLFGINLKKLQLITWANIDEEAKDKYQHEVAQYLIWLFMENIKLRWHLKYAMRKIHNPPEVQDV